MINSQKGFSKIVVVIIVAIIIIVAGRWFFRRPYTNIYPVTPTPTSSPSPTPSPITSPTAGWQTYRNEQYGFEVKYPQSYRPIINMESSSELVIEFSSSEKDFIVDFMVIAARTPIKEAVGDVKATKNIAIDGVKGIQKDIQYYLGYNERYSVRFEGNNNFFEILSPEITELSSAEQFLTQILSTFKFLK